MPAVLSHYPSGTSVKNIEHFAQGVRSGRFSPYDNGKTKNMEIYNESSPPEYKLSGFNVPTYIFYSKDDLLADLKVNY